MRTVVLQLLICALAPSRAALSPVFTDVQGGGELLFSFNQPLTSVPTDLQCIVGEQPVPAVLHASRDKVSCTAPASPLGRLGRVSVRVMSGSHTLGNAALLTYYDRSHLPQLTAVQPRSSNGAQPERLRVLGTNFAPLAPDAMLCRFGNAQPTAATFISPTEVACLSPMLVDGSLPTRSVGLQISLDGAHTLASLPTTHSLPHGDELT